MKDSAFPIIVVPFDGVQIPIKIRCLNYTQIRSCGNFSIFDFDSKKSKRKEIPIESIIQTVNIQEKILRQCLISPTYDEIVEKVYGDDQAIIEKKNRIKEIRAKIDGLSMADKIELSEELDTLEMYIGYQLPQDFTAHIVDWQINQNRTDARKITREMLLEAAFSAERGNDNPSDHLDGDFNKFHIENINNSAWKELDEYRKSKELEKNAGKSIRGGQVKLN